MVGFQAKEISNPPRLSERLKNSREARGLSLSQVAKDTNIGVKYLEALEAGDYQKLPGEVYAKSFLKAYTKYLGLKSEDFLESFRTEHNIYTKTKSDYSFDAKKPVERVAASQLLVTPKLARGIIVGLLALLCLIYLGSKVSKIMSPPFLIIEQPADQLVTQQSFIEVSGRVGAESTLEING
jgi:cytoskeletal protein RodZ